MVNFEPHILIRWGGTLGEDTWSCGMRFMQTAGNVSNDQWASDNLEDCADAVRDFFTAAGSMHNGLATLGWVKVNGILANGHYEAPNDPHLKEFVPPVNPYSAANHAPQLALCATLRTAVKRGRAHSGRIYVPTMMDNVTDDGRLPGTTCAELATATVDLIETLNALPGGAGNGRVSVFSPLSRCTTSSPRWRSATWSTRSSDGDGRSRKPIRGWPSARPCGSRLQLLWRGLPRRASPLRSAARGGPGGRLGRPGAEPVCRCTTRRAEASRRRPCTRSSARRSGRRSSTSRSGSSGLDTTS